MDVKSAARVLDLFEAYADLKRALTLKELAAHLQVPMSSCFNLVRTAESRGYLYAAQARSLYPTRRLYDVARTILEHDPVVSRCGAVLAALRDETGESVCLAKRQDLSVMYLDVHDSPHRIRYIVRPGETRELHANSMGKAILDSLPKAERDAILERMPYTRFSAATLRGRTALEANLKAARARGWYGNEGETVSDALGAALPVRIAGEWYGISIVGPNYRMKEKLSSHLAALRKAAAEVSDTPVPSRSTRKSA